jgi:precorrin-6B methylase 2
METLYQPLAISTEPLQILLETQQLCEILAAAVEVQLFEKMTTLTRGADLARAEDWDKRTTEFLLDVLAHAGYVERDGDRYKNTQLSTTYLCRNSFLYLGHNFTVAAQAGPICRQLLEALRQEGNQAFSPEPNWNPERLRQIGVSGLEGSLQMTVEAVDLTGVKHLLDLGGGHGFYSIAFAQKYEDVNVTLFDLPDVIPLANTFIARYDLEQRIETLAGNFLVDSIGTGYDAILCANILHREKRAVVLPKVYAALNAGGRIIVKCRVLDSEQTLSAALERLLWHIRGGKEFLTQDQWHELLRQAGFVEVETLGTDRIFATIIGQKPNR